VGTAGRCARAQAAATPAYAAAVSSSPTAPGSDNRATTNRANESRVGSINGESQTGFQIAHSAARRGSPSTWTNTAMPFRAFAVDKNGDFYCSGVNGVFKYNTYTPDGANSAYNFEYQTQWLDGGDESRLKHFKNVILGLKAASGQTGTFRWREDYVAGATRTAAFTCDAIEFAEDPGLGQVKVHIGGSCNVGQFGFAMPINGDGVELHLMQIAAVTGKTSFR
jgi:hypothetical protein